MRVRTVYRLTLASAGVAAMIAELIYLSELEGAPARAVQAYFQAVADKHCDAAFTLLTDPIRSTFGSRERLCRHAATDDLVRFEIGESTRSGDTARVLVTLVRRQLTSVDAVSLS